MFRNEYEKENVKHFVENMRETLWKREWLEGVLPLLLIFGVFPLFMGFVYMDEGYEIVPGIISSMMIVVVIIYLMKMRTMEETYFSRFITMGLGATALSLVFLDLGIFFLFTQKGNGVHLGLVISIYILFFVVIFGGTLYGIKKDWYRPRISKFQRAKQIKMIAPAAVLGATAGGLIFKKFIDDLGHVGMAYLGLMVAVVFIFGTTYFLKAYYVKKYGFTDPYEDGWYKPKRRKLKEAENEEAEIEGEKSK